MILFRRHCEERCWTLFQLLPLSIHWDEFFNVWSFWRDPTDRCVYLRLGHVLMVWHRCGGPPRPCT